MRPGRATRPLAHQSSQEAIASPPLRRDWGEAIDVSAFYGRESELVELERWIVDEHCRLVALLSRGGYGKTALSVKLTQQIARHFDVVIWRSLQHAPPLERLLADYLTFLSEQHTIDLPESTGERMTLLFAYLRTARCLLVLDNVETPTRYATRLQQAGNKRDDNIFMKEKSGKVPWEEEIKRYVRIVKAH